MNFYTPRVEGMLWRSTFWEFDLILWTTASIATYVMHFWQFCKRMGCNQTVRILWSIYPADYFIEYSHLSGDVARQGPDPLRQKPAPDSREGMLILKSCRNCVGPIFTYLYFAYLRSYGTRKEADAYNQLPCKYGNVSVEVLYTVVYYQLVYACSIEAVPNTTHQPEYWCMYPCCSYCTRNWCM